MTENVSGAVLLIMVLGVLLISGIWATAAAVDAQSDDVDESEVVEITDGWSELEADADRYHSQTVEINDEEVVESDDYFWNADDGEIAFNNTRHPTGEAQVNYTASSMPDQTASVVSILSPIWNMGAWLPIVALGGAIFAGLSYLSKQQGRGGAY